MDGIKLISYDNDTGLYFKREGLMVSPIEISIRYECRVDNDTFSIRNERYIYYDEERWCKTYYILANNSNINDTNDVESKCDSFMEIYVNSDCHIMRINVIHFMNYYFPVFIDDILDKHKKDLINSTGKLYVPIHIYTDEFYTRGRKDRYSRTIDTPEIPRICVLPPMHIKDRVIIDHSNRDNEHNDNDIIIKDDNKLITNSPSNSTIIYGISLGLIILLFIIGIPVIFILRRNLLRRNRITSSKRYNNIILE